MWQVTEAGNWIYGDIQKGVYLSYRPETNFLKEWGHFLTPDEELPEEHRGISKALREKMMIIPEETAIVIPASDENSYNKYMILNGDKRADLEALYPDVKALIKYYEESEDQSEWSTYEIGGKENQ